MIFLYIFNLFLIIYGKFSNFREPYYLESVKSIDDSNHSPSEEYLVDFYDSKVYLQHLTSKQLHDKRVLYCHEKHRHGPRWDNGMNYHHRRWKFIGESKYKKKKQKSDLEAI